MTEFIVVMPRVEGNPEIGYDTQFYSDMKRCPNLAQAIRHGAVDLDQSDDFLVGQVDGNTLISLQWMEEVRDDRDELAKCAGDIGFRTR